MKLPFPKAFEDRMRLRLGMEEWQAFSAAHELPSPTSIRINPEKYSDTIAQRVPWTSLGGYLASRPVFTLDPSFHAGAYYVQEPSSMFLEKAFSEHVPKDKPLRVLDLCAAPGGKSTHLLSLLSSESILVSNEVIRSRVSILTENIQKWGHDNCVITSNDAADFAQLPGFFDVIVVDAPCSGEGLFRKDANAIKEWSERNAEMCSARQKRILEDVWPTLKEDGILIYSTCTYNAAENDLNLLWLCDNHRAECLNLDVSPEWKISEIINGKITGYQFYPHNVQGEGFFLSVLRKKETQRGINMRNAAKNFLNPPRKVSDELTAWLLPGDHSFIQRNDTIQMLPLIHREDIAMLAQYMNVYYSGVYVATRKHDKLIPEHALALFNGLNRKNFVSVDLSREQAIQYLRKENLSIDLTHRGFSLSTYQNLALGWMNVLPGRINNLYPAEWRIRMQV